MQVWEIVRGAGMSVMTINPLSPNFVLSQWTLFFITLAVLLISSEIGFYRGLPLFRSNDKARKDQIGTIQAAVLGLLALLLGFTFSMAVERYDTRRRLVVQEANTIGTTYLRASMLPPAHQGPVKAALRQYVETRIRTRAGAGDPTMLAAGLRESARIQAELWSHATAASQEAPTAITASFVVTLNEMIDTDAERVAAGRAQIPAGVWLVVIMVAGFGSFTTGYNAGASGVRTLLGGVLVPLLLALVIVLIVDLSHPLQGMIGISQQSMVDLRNSMAP